MEICHNGEWGTVCDDYFDIADANVVCRQLGYSGAIRYHSYFGRGSGHIWLDNVECLGNETTLDACAHNGFGIHNCNHKEDVGVVCQGKTQKLCPLIDRLYY